MKNRAAVTLGRLGGRVKSAAKAAAARANGRKGGRPRKARTSVDVRKPAKAGELIAGEVMDSVF
jgi:hypothetical protein